MILFAFFTDNGVPKTGLSPTIDVLEADGTVVINAQNMSEVGRGFYKYDFSGYDGDEDYVIRADGGAVLANAERYVYTTNEEDTSTIETIVRRSLGLNQENFRIFNPTYDRNNNLTSALIKTYNNASDCNNSVNPLAQYQITATYSRNKMATYKVVKV